MYDAPTPEDPTSGEQNEFEMKPDLSSWQAPASNPPTPDAIAPDDVEVEFMTPHRARPDAVTSPRAASDDAVSEPSELDDPMPRRASSTPRPAMAHAAPAASSGVSAWWALVLLPVGLLGGWLVGAMPVKSKPATASAVAFQTTSPSATQRPGSGATSAGTNSGAAAGPTSLFANEKAAADAKAEAVEAGELSQWSSLQDAVAESRRNGKPVMIDFNAEWCGPCQAMKRQLFDDAKRGRAVQTAVIPVSIVDRVREDGSNPSDIEALQKRFEVNAFPTLVVFNPGTGRTVKTEGYGGGEATQHWIEQAATAVR